jgi:hypothetical protein
MKYLSICQLLTILYADTMDQVYIIGIFVQYRGEATSEQQ